VRTEARRDTLRRLVEDLRRNKGKIGRDAEATIHARIAEIDRQLSAQVNEVMHSEGFQKMEATWRGLQHLLSQTPTSSSLQVRMLDVTKEELVKDLDPIRKPDQSALYNKIYRDAYDRFGAAPFGALVGDYYFDASSNDVRLLGGLSRVAAMAHAPLITGTSPKMLNMRSFTQINEPYQLDQIFEKADYAAWKSFRQTEDSRYVALTLPRMLLRAPYGSESIPAEGFNFEEDVDGRDHDRYLWGNAAWALAARVTLAYAKNGWCANIRGVESGGLVEGLPTHTFRADHGDTALKCPTETPIPMRRDAELAKLGFVSLVHRHGTDKAAFFGVQSAQKAKEYEDDEATKNAAMSAQLPYIFAVSRFAQYLNVLLRHKIGLGWTRERAEQFLNDWIMNYVVSNPDAGEELRAKNPLRDAEVKVTEVPGRPGVYSATAYLVPHFQLDAIKVSLRLVSSVSRRS
jgi:type VI secretion system protein ImpC